MTDQVDPAALVRFGVRLAELEQNVENLVVALRRLAVVDRLEGRVAELEKVSHRPARNVPDADDLDRELANIVARLDVLEARTRTPIMPGEVAELVTRWAPEPAELRERERPPPATPARIVLYRNVLGGVWPAIVTRTHNDPLRNTALDLYVFNSESSFPQAVFGAELVNAAGDVAGWFWPPRV
jgi:hypothetical protein